MAKVIEITEKKMEKMSDLVEDMLLAGGELMHCLTKMEDEMYGERSSGGDRYRINYRNYGERDWQHEDYDRDDDMSRGMMGERRRYSRRMR